MSIVSRWDLMLDTLRKPEKAPKTVVKKRAQNQKNISTKVKYVYKVRRGEQVFYMVHGYVDKRLTYLYWGKDFEEAVRVRRQWEIDSDYASIVKEYKKG